MCGSSVLILTPNNQTNFGVSLLSSPPPCMPSGEATHPAVNPCMQAALETGQRAATQVTAALTTPSSRL